MFSSAIAFFTVSRLPSLFTPRITKGWFLYCFTSDRSCGYMARQGPHQWPQKSRNTTLPR